MDPPNGITSMNTSWILGRDSNRVILWKVGKNTTRSFKSNKLLKS